MAKLLLLLVVIGIALWLISGRRRGRRPDASTRTGKSAETKAAAPMLACVHCGMHVPQDEASFDVGGRAFCSEAHRLAGPR